MTLNERLRLKHYSTPKPYQFQVANIVYEYDPAANRTRIIEVKPLAPLGLFEYEDGLLHIRPSGDLQRKPRPK